MCFGAFGLMATSLQIDFAFIPDECIVSFFDRFQEDYFFFGTSSLLFYYYPTCTCIMIMVPVGIYVLTLPVVFPLIVKLGYDPNWFGVIALNLTEIGSITPLVGLNIFARHEGDNTT